jgi:antitoxin YefM
MKTISFSDSRANYAATLDSVTEDHEEVIITRQGKPPVVVMALDDYTSMVETAFLMRVPANARHLLDSIGELARGEAVERELADSDSAAPDVAEPDRL